MLSKSKYIKGLQCEKRLWLDKHRRDLKPPIDPATQAMFDQGHRVGDLAQQKYPGGKDASPEDYRKLYRSVAQTRESIERGEAVIYEATFDFDAVLVMMDILLREGDRWRAIEVKSSTAVKAYHLNDAAIQYHVITGAGIDLIDIEIMYLDNTYDRQGELDVDRLFTSESVLEQILPMQEEIPERIRSFIRYCSLRKNLRSLSARIARTPSNVTSWIIAGLTAFILKKLLIIEEALIF